MVVCGVNASGGGKRLIDINIKQSNQMAMEQYPQETIPQTTFVKDSETTSEKWKSLSESIDESENSPSAGFDCNICLDSVQDPVVTLCGHLYCWPCIYKWIQHQNTSPETPNKHNPQCPVCKHDISQKTLVPLYSQGQTTKPQSEEKGLDLGMSIPRRPACICISQKSYLTLLI
ncbi:unnamed protein product [Lactuca saligna]|uniref:E3 ubiquitin-protein ligase RMA n=1 Tax=Lactuca saligna TaxID=75948 RepID=A0AA35Y7Y9_LACSI|nr:unnamed protein product [Lactuca saligna]